VLAAARLFVALKGNASLVVTALGALRWCRTWFD